VVAAGREPGATVTVAIRQPVWATARARRRRPTAALAANGSPAKPNSSGITRKPTRIWFSVTASPTLYTRARTEEQEHQHRGRHNSRA
jgi:hypothetical protein